MLGCNGHRAYLSAASRATNQILLASLFFGLGFFACRSHALAGPHAPVSSLDIAPVEIVKIDPSPVEAAQRFATVVRITNTKKQELLIRMRPKNVANYTTFGNNLFQVAAGGSLVAEITGSFANAGSHNFTIEVDAQTGISPASGQPIYAEFGEDSTAVAVYALGRPPATPYVFDASPNESPGINGGTTASGVRSSTEPRYQRKRLRKFR